MELALREASSLLGAKQSRRRIGMLWGDFPWTEPARKVGKLLSTGVVARNVTRALSAVGHVVPYVPPPRDAPPSVHRGALASFLRSIDVLWADAYPASEPAMRLRDELGLPCRALIFAAGAMPKGAEAMLFPWQRLLTPHDSLLFTCEADRAIWRRLVRRSSLREWVIPLAVDETVYYPRAEEDRLAERARLNLPATAPLLIYVGRFNIQKNLHTLLRLLAAVHREVPGAHLCFVGEEDDIVLGEFGVRNTGYVAWLRDLAVELGVAEQVSFLGPRFGEDLARLYAAADVLVNASFYHRENFGLSQAEAQACATPVVCTAWGGFKDVVRHGETGYLMDAVLTKHGVRVDWAAGACHVIALLQNRERRRGLPTGPGERAAEFARQRFSIAALARALGHVIAEALRSRGGGFDSGNESSAYEPSRFASRYEAHKRACGWYADTPGSPAPRDDAHPRWYPPMFQGRDYALYETLMQPYATRLARDLAVHAIRPELVPYFPSPVDLDPMRYIADDRDPVWPHRRYLPPLEWEVLRRIDGVTTVGEIVQSIVAHDNAIDAEAIATALWQAHVEGFVLFQNEDHPTPPDGS